MNFLFSTSTVKQKFDCKERWIGDEQCYFKLYSYNFALQNRIMHESLDINTTLSIWSWSLLIIVYFAFFSASKWESNLKQLEKNQPITAFLMVHHGLYFITVITHIQSCMMNTAAFLLRTISKGHLQQRSSLVDLSHLLLGRITDLPPKFKKLHKKLATSEQLCN